MRPEIHEDDDLLSKREPSSLEPPEQNLSAYASKIQNLAVQWANEPTLPLHHAVLDLLFELTEQELKAALIIAHMNGGSTRPNRTAWEIRKRLEQTMRDRADHNRT